MSMPGTPTEKLVFGGIGALLLGTYVYLNPPPKHVPPEKLSAQGRLRWTKMKRTR
jgi:hypothetical protein